MPLPFRFSLASASLALLVGCTSATSPAVPHEPAPLPPRVEAREDSCGAGRVQDRVGRAYDEALAQAILEESGAGALRVVRPGHAYTMEYRDDRINVHVDENEVIADIGCG